MSPAVRTGGHAQIALERSEQEVGHQLTALELPGQVAGLVEAFNTLVN